MRIFAVVIVIVLALGAGFAGYYSFWHKQADVLLHGFLQAQKKLDDSASTFAPGVKILKYDTVSVTGFPTAMVLEVTKPVLNVPVSAIIKQAQLEKGVTTPLPYEWVEEASWADKWTITSNIKLTQVTITATGDRTDRSLINNAVRHTLVANAASPLSCTLTTDKSLQFAVSDVKTFFSSFRSVDCNIKDFAFKDTSGKTLLTMAGGTISSSTSLGSDGNRKFGFLMDLDKLKSTPDFDATFYDYMLMSYTLMGIGDQLGSSMPLSAYGEYSAKVDARYDGPSDQAGMANPNSVLRFDLNSFDLHSALASFSITAHVSKALQGNDRMFTVSLHESLESSEQAEALAKKNLVDMLTKLQKNPTTDSNAGMQFFQKLSTFGPPEQVVDRLYPNFHSLGKASLGLDFNVRGPNNDATFLKQGTVTLDDFSLVATPYSIRLKGGASTSPGKMPQGDLSLTCTSCDALVSDLGDYAMRIESVVSQISKPPKPLVLTKDLFDGVKQFLHGISENATASDVVIELVAKNNGFTISGKQLPEVMAVYMTTIAPHLPQPSGAMGGQPELSAPPSPQGQ